MKVNKKELLAPAGSYKALVAAVYAGCDAVYLGGSKFGARANAENFTNETLPDAIDFAHLHGVKVYYAANTLIKEDEMADFLEQVHFLYREGVDALIIQDLGVYQLLQETFPELPLHASTQMTVHNLDGVLWLEKLGFERVVLSRELSLSEIEFIKKNSQIELECFIHGALCVCYSGQCLFSSLIGGRSGNRGTCAQPCRLPYDLYSEKNKISSSTDRFLLSPKDIQTLEILPALMESGIHTFKIEGRMKNPNYVALMTALYRKYMDAYLEKPESYKVEPADLIDMHQIYNRGGFSTGYYEVDKGPSMMSHDRPNHSGIPIGYVSKIVDYKNIQMTLNQPVRQGDALEIGSRNHDPFSFTAKENMSGISNTIYVGKHENKVGDVVHKMTDVALAEKIDQNILQKPHKLPVKMAFKARIGEVMILELTFLEHTFLVYGSAVESAKTSAITPEKVETQLRKTGNDPVWVTHIDFDMDENIFISIKELNDLRREAIEKLMHSRIAPWKRQVLETKYKPPKIVNPLVSNRIHVLLRRMDQLEAVLNYEIDALYLELSNFTRNEIKSIATRCLSLNIGVYVALPRIIRDSYRDKIHNELEYLKTIPISGVMIRTLDVFERVKKDFNIVIDYTLNSFNKKAIEFWTLQGVEAIGVSPELHQQEIAQLGGAINEVVVYGYLPLMVTTQCLHKNSDNRCHQPEAILSLKDRKNMSFQVYKDCTMCFNTIYNALPVLLIDKTSELKKSNIHRFRIELLHENAKQIHTILSYAMGLKNSLVHSKEEMPVTQAIGDFTRGHFAKGIK